jgi:NAD(P)-dependent dehydrogenase (short-subunit alcohol dehydrogenase family)
VNVLLDHAGPLGVRVNAICPGYVANSMGRSVPGTPANIVPDSTVARANGANPTQEAASEVRKSLFSRHSI